MRYVPRDPPHVVVHAEYRMKNVGTKPLDAIAFGLPDKKGFGRADLRVEMNGHQLATQNSGSAEIEADAGESAASASWPAAEEFILPSAWRKNQTHQFVVDYEVQSTPKSDSRIFLNSDSFYLDDSGWFPNPLEAKGLLAKDITRPNSVDFRVDVPASFLARASGEYHGKKKNGGEIEYRFRIRPDDFGPFVLAGKFQEQQVTSSGAKMTIWMRGATIGAQEQALANDLGAAAAHYESAIDALPRSVQRILMVSGFSEPGAGRTAQESPSASLPGVVFVRTGETGEQPESALAETWFRHLVRPQPEASSLADGLSFYTADSNRERVKGNSREGTIKALLSKQNTVPQDHHSTMYSKPSPSKVELFLFALEDRCGNEKLQHGIAQMVYALRGEDYGYSDFRAAVEQECGQNLDRLFDDWLRKPGIPAAFRAKYEEPRK